MSQEFTAGVTLLAPRITDSARFDRRYAGLVGELIVNHDLPVALVSSHDTYNFKDFFTKADSLTVSEGLIVRSAIVGVLCLAHAGVIRDLTMPELDDKPVYESKTARSFVNPPNVNAILRRKASVYELMPELHALTLIADNTEHAIELVRAATWRQIVVKPSIGSNSKGIIVGDKNDIETQLRQLGPNTSPDGRLLVQEYLDTSADVPELDITGIHNIRVLSIEGKAIFAAARLEPNDKWILRDDKYGRFYRPDELPKTMIDLVGQAHAKLALLDGAKHTVLAIDLMRGTDSNGKQRDVVCEINRRPLRISSYNLHQREEPVFDPVGLKRAARRWDKAEASMLARLAVEA